VLYLSKSVKESLIIFFTLSDLSLYLSNSSSLFFNLSSTEASAFAAAALSLAASNATFFPFSLSFTPDPA
jgi:hypothetical protein